MTSTLKPIRNKADHQAALAEIAALMDAPKGSAEADRLAVLAVLVADYERRATPIEAPDAADVLELAMQNQGRTQADLAAALNSRSRASEVLARRRALSPQMADHIAALWAIPRRLLGPPGKAKPSRAAKGVAIVLLAFALTGGAIGGAGVAVRADLPSIAPVRDYAGGATFTPLSALPPHVVQAFLAAEDGEFYRHGGYSPSAIARASADNLGRFGAKPDGGATITQQVAKNLLLSGERPSLLRKWREIMLAEQIEASLPKDRILEIYLNQLYFGGETHGLREAAAHYFNAAPEAMSVAQAAYLAGLPKAPNAYRFDKPGNGERARAWRDWVLARMQAQGFVSLAAADNARAQPLVR
jgi:penicillin-binding protein 1A